MYRVNVSITLVARNGLMGLSRWVQLPFAPYPGLDLVGLTSDAHCEETVAAVAWDFAGKCFWIELLECETLAETLTELIDYYGPDWDLHEPGTEPVCDSS